MGFMYFRIVLLAGGTSFFSIGVICRERKEEEVIDSWQVTGLHVTVVGLLIPAHLTSSVSSILRQQQS